MSNSYYYGHGKLLLTGEYLVLDGAKSLALPTQLGQQMHVQYRPSSDPKLYWKSLDQEGKVWFEATFELWHFNILSFNEECVSIDKVEALQGILRQARAQNIHFLRDQLDSYVTTKLEFPLEWGLGTSSTLIYNVAQWAYVSPFELLEKTFGGSGYDIACAQSFGPIIFQNLKQGPLWETANFYPAFKDNIYFVYQNRKQNSREEISRYRALTIEQKHEAVDKINKITTACLDCIDLKEFENLIFDHENVISKVIDKPTVQQDRYSDYWGAIKSLGAWGGDFIMVTSSKPKEEVESYFRERGLDQILSYDELILQNFPKFSTSSEPKLESGQALGIL